MRCLSLAVLPLVMLSNSLETLANPPDCPEVGGNLRRIVLDPGHGGTNEGAVGVAGIYERFLTLETSMALQQRLRACFPAIEVTLTRHDDVDLSLGDRTFIANVDAADLFVSVHYNAAVNPDAQGVEVFYLSSQEEAPTEWGEDAVLIGASGAVVASILRDLDRTWLQEQSARVAELLLGELVARTGALNRGVREGRFRVLRGALMPAVVVELGFLTHPEEGRRLVDPAYTAQLVEALLRGIAAWDRSLAEPE